MLTENDSSSSEQVVQRVGDPASEKSRGDVRSSVDLEEKGEMIRDASRNSKGRTKDSVTHKSDKPLISLIVGLSLESSDSELEREGKVSEREGKREGESQLGGTRRARFGKT